MYTASVATGREEDGWFLIIFGERERRKDGKDKESL